MQLSSIMATTDGAYFEIQGDQLNPFEVLSLPVDDNGLTRRDVRMHCRNVVCRHVVAPARTRGPRVPTCSQVYRARDILLASLEEERKVWAGFGVHQTWNPREPPGSPAALISWISTGTSHAVAVTSVPCINVL